MSYWTHKSTIMMGRKYPDGEPIPDSLPSLYRIGERCDNCGAYVAETKYCESWDAVVRPEYVCAVWVPIQGRW